MQRGLRQIVWPDTTALKIIPGPVKQEAQRAHAASCDELSTLCLLNSIFFFFSSIHMRPAAFCTRWESNSLCKTSLTLWTLKVESNGFLIKRKTVLYHYITLPLLFYQYFELMTIKGTLLKEQCCHIKACTHPDVRSVTLHVKKITSHSRVLS